VNAAPSPTDRQRSRFWGSRASIGLIVVGAVAAFFLLAEHRAHVFGALPFLLLLACPLMHVFMHRSHGSHGSHRGGDGQRQQDRQPPSAGGTS
jgi:hypothetical protein